MNPLHGYLLLAALLFSIGLAGALTRRNAILVLVGIERNLRPALAQLGEAGVLGDGVDPGRKLRLAGEPGQGAPDAQEDVLRGVFGQCAVA